MLSPLFCSCTQMVFFNPKRPDTPCFGAEVTSFTLFWPLSLDPPSPPQVLPEEAVSHRIVVAEATREEFLQQLCTSSSFLLSSLEQIAAGPLGAEIMVQVPVFLPV